VIGARTSIQDGCVVHTTDHDPTIIGDDCVVGHLAHLEGATVEDRCLIGVGSIVLHRVVVRTGAVVAANAVVLDDTEVPSGAVALGVPAKIREGMARLADIDDAVANYLDRLPRYRDGLRRLG
jgi:carbonic anhydrase/acetyltransferase-like protein (isoleucine patch superfamily)